MGRTTYKQPELALSDADRVTIARAREAIKDANKALAEFGLSDPVEPLTELGYEQRMARMKALELAANGGFGSNSDKTVEVADKFYQFIWKGDTP